MTFTLSQPNCNPHESYKKSVKPFINVLPTNFHHD